jgi:uncharacterized protein YjbJ (UPF0337 family)
MEDEMSNQSERSEGTAEKLGGKLKKGVGRLLGNRRLEAKGRATELKGNARIAAAKSSERAKGKAESLIGAAKNRVGRVIGNERMIVGGKAKELKGEARQRGNR